MRFIGHIAHKLDIIVTRGQLIAMEIVKGFFFERTLSDLGKFHLDVKGYRTESRSLQIL